MVNAAMCVAALKALAAWEGLIASATPESRVRKGKNVVAEEGEQRATRKGGSWGGEG